MTTRLKLFNTESRSLEEVIPLNGNTVRIYTCGPTVYNFAHIGNFRTYIFEDVLCRTIKFFGMEVRQVMNLTDIDDKTLHGAIEKGISLEAFTKPYKEAFFQDIAALGIEKAETYPEATAFIPSMMQLIEELLSKGIAYQGADGSIYFAISRFPSYGRLSHLQLDELKTGASQRMADEYDKENAADFVLWKAYDPVRDGNIFWESPFGPGRPGWHIECSAMAMSILGESIDIHAGGIDNMFPHHENEIAQSEACSGHHFVRIWVHSEHLLVDHKKMSKSLGNFYTLRDLFNRGYSGRQVRFMLLSTHYRTQLNFTFQGMQAAGASLERLDDFIDRLGRIKDGASQGKAAPCLDIAYTQFRAALGDDLNISLALAALFDLVRSINVLIDQKQISAAEAEQTLEFLKTIDQVLGVLFFGKEQEDISIECQELLQRREDARMHKEWQLADECRDLLQSRGYFIEDTPSGARLKKIKK
ncbi:MAG: cysteine--tRNA ligase [Simkania sp.]|nr:cysteine--tRNA ligase [Simkania sp.]